MSQLASNASYDQAHQQLRQILSERALRLQAKVDPWWLRGLKWIARHLHLSVSRQNLQLVTWLLAAGAAVVIVLAVIWWLRSMRRVGSSRIARAHFGDAMQMVSLDDATAAYQRGEYREMLHCLVDVALSVAADRGWLKVAPYKTMRMYVRDLAKVSDSEFREAFGQLAEVAERVLFAESELSQSQADVLLHRLRQIAVEVQA